MRRPGTGGSATIGSPDRPATGHRLKGSAGADRPGARLALPAAPGPVLWIFAVARIGRMDAPQGGGGA
ncbi:hypothetical protein, partial [Streptosporangium sp. NPDC048865]|uniref:hypothetical protein n=1 Tax=Streptosporangium sp. NPDC048865 TaxID=3155766 RepID=UPI0034168B90